MKFITSMLVLLGSALAMAADADRELQIADWHVTILTMADTGFTFETGAGGGTNPNIKVTVTDVCRLTSATRVNVGQLFPTSYVVGIDADGGGIVNNPGAGNALDDLDRG